MLTSEHFATTANSAGPIRSHGGSGSRPSANGGNGTATPFESVLNGLIDTSGPAGPTEPADRAADGAMSNSGKSEKRTAKPLDNNADSAASSKHVGTSTRDGSVTTNDATHSDDADKAMPAATDPGLLMVLNAITQPQAASTVPNVEGSPAGGICSEFAAEAAASTASASHDLKSSVQPGTAADAKFSVQGTPSDSLIAALSRLQASATTTGSGKPAAAPQETLPAADALPPTDRQAVALLNAPAELNALQTNVRATEPGQSWHKEMPPASDATDIARRRTALEFAADAAVPVQQATLQPTRLAPRPQATRDAQDARDSLRTTSPATSRMLRADRDDALLATLNWATQNAGATAADATLFSSSSTSSASIAGPGAHSGPSMPLANPTAAIAMGSSLPGFGTALTGATHSPERVLQLASAPTTPAWRGEFVDSMRMLVNDRVQSAELQLNPVDMGPVSIRITMIDQQANIAFGAMHEETRRSIEQALPQLRDMFAGSGIQLGNATVGHQASREQPQQQAAPSHEQRNAEVTPQPALRPLRASRNLVDTYA
jgi:flagellar hook-length control protein FliK